MPERERPTAVDPAFWHGRRVLVTGHTGFKGAWLTLWLTAMGAEVGGLADGVPTEPSVFTLAGVRDALASEVTGDVRDAATVREALAGRPEVVLHLAAQPMVRRSFAEPRETFATNVMGTVNVLDAVRTHGAGVRSVVVVTSDKCYDDRGRRAPYVEGDPMGGHDPYSSSKGCAELVTDAYRRSFFGDPDGPRVASARAGNVIGGGDWGTDRLLPDLVRAAQGGTPIALRNPAAVRPWQHVLNPLSGYLLLAQQLHAGADVAAPFNFGPPSADAQPVGAIVERVAELWGTPLEVDGAPGPHPHEAPFLALDSTRAHERLGWAPRWGLDQALRATVAWHRGLLDGDEARGLTLRQIEEFVAS